ncbi:MAG: penicillin acylase family protein [Candidatus Korobacteraceae bacterium]|jgi:penicillin amidase
MPLTAAPVRPPKSKIIFRAVIAALVLLLLAFLGFDFWFYRAVRAALPQRDGTVRLAGLTAPVIITYDTLAVPNISASNLPDLFFAQGYITAQDRLWQMDMTRRFASGDLAVILGPKYLKYDREQRILGLRQVAEQAAANMLPLERAQFEAYAAGVNAYIEQHRKTLPLEFRFLGYSPHVWTVEDSLLVGLSMTEFLNHGLYQDKLEKEKILARLGPELTADLYVNTSWRDHPPGADSSSMELETPQETTPDEEEQSPQGPNQKSDEKQIPRGQSSFPQDPGKQIPRFARDDKTSGDPQHADDQHLRPGSNNWVISGAHTASGKPLLSNDMHLDLEIPNVWYEAHLTAGDFDVAGVTLPGVPYVIVGHNRRIAWGFTNLGPNVEDLYIEKFNDQGEYLTPQGWVNPGHRQEIIRVIGAPEVTLDVVNTRHGPIITDLIPGETRKLALKWTVYDPQATRVPFFAIDSAQNWQEFEAAFSQFGAPGQNVVYADVDGHIGYQATGLIPIRATGDGSLPVPGDDDAHEWTGYVPYDKLPSVYDPPSGVIASANGRVTRDGYPYELAIQWMSPYRTQRIYKLLNAPKKFTPADMLAIQTDVVSPFDRFCAERFVYAVDHTAHASARAKSAAELMRNWDGTMDIDSPAATIAVFSREKLKELLLQPRLGEGWQDYKWFMSSVWLENVMDHQPPRWLPPGYSGYDELLTRAVEEAVDDASATRALSLWKWGRVHRVDIQHPFWSHFPILKKGAGTGSLPLSGDEETIKQVAPHFGPSERLTADFSDLDTTTLDIVNGESGNIFDDHYNDQWDAYYHGRTFALPFSQNAVQHAGAHHLRLEPQSK